MLDYLQIEMASQFKASFHTLAYLETSVTLDKISAEVKKLKSQKAIVDQELYRKMSQEKELTKKKERFSKIINMTSSPEDFSPAKYGFMPPSSPSPCKSSPNVTPIKPSFTSPITCENQTPVKQDAHKTQVKQDENETPVNNGATQTPEMQCYKGDMDDDDDDDDDALMASIELGNHSELNHDEALDLLMGADNGNKCHMSRNKSEQVAIEDEQNVNVVTDNSDNCGGRDTQTKGGSENCDVKDVVNCNENAKRIASPRESNVSAKGFGKAIKQSNDAQTKVESENCDVKDVVNCNENAKRIARLEESNVCISKRPNVSEPMSVEEKKAKIAEGNEVSNFKKNILNLF